LGCQKEIVKSVGRVSPGPISSRRCFVQTVVSSSGWAARTEDVPLRQLVAMPVDVGKSSAMVMACDFTRRTIMPATEFPLTRPGIATMLARLRSALPAEVGPVRVGVEAAGHYHQPMIAPGV
jgi:hypothetical protein